MGLNYSFSGAPSNSNIPGSNPYQLPDFSDWASMSSLVQKNPLPTTEQNDQGYFKNIYDRWQNPSTNSNTLPNYNDIISNPKLKKQLSTPIWDQQNSNTDSSNQSTTTSINYLDPNASKNLFKQQNQKTNQLGFMVGQQTQNSTNTNIAAQGKQMVQQGVEGKDITGFKDTQSGVEAANKPDYLSAGIDAVGQLGSQIASKVGGNAGKTIGEVTTGLTHMTQGIKKAVSNRIGASMGDKLAKGAKSAGISSAIGAAADIASAFLPDKDEYTGDKGNITETMDSVYDGISDAAMAFGPIGAMVGGIMKGGKFLSKGMNAIGGGTDGMCVCTGTKVFTANGSIVNIEDLKKEDGIIGWDETKKQIVPQLIHNFIEPRQKECLEIVLKNGYSIKCSIDHPILSDNSPKARNRVVNGKRIAIRPWEFRRADELKVGDFVGLANNIDYWGDTNVPDAYVVGLLIGDGSYGKGSSCRLISADPDTWRYLEDNNLGVLNHCDDSKPEKYNKEIRTYRIIGGMELLHQLGIAYQIEEDKTLPKNIGKFDKSSVCNLLAGLFDTDGSISVNEEKQNYSITLYQSNINLLEEVRMQLHKLGIFSTIETRKTTKYELGGRIINSNESYRLEIHDILSAIKFYNLIPLNISYKKESLERIYNMLKDKRVQEHNDISGAKQCKIVSITPIGVQTVYNLQADYNHTYLANCIITHNTTTDAILGSSFLSLTPIGLINGFGGSTTQKLAKNDEAFEQVGASYLGSNSTVDDAVHKSGKKYGLFSKKAFHKANELIDKARLQQDTITSIADQSRLQQQLQASMSAINSNRYAMKMQGGFDPTAIRAAKHGMTIQLLQKAHDIIKAQKGNKITKPSYKEWVKTVNPRFINDNYDLETAYKYLPYKQLQRWKFAVNSKNPNYYMNYRDKNGKYIYHLGSVAQIPNTEDYIFLKKGTLDTNPELKGELDYYNNSGDFKNNYDLSYEGDRYYYRKKKPQQELPQHKNGGSIIHETYIELVSPLELPQHKNGGSIIELTKDSIIELIDPLTVPEFQNGGSINVIPEGALHARKHNMDIDGITKKGIPVVSEGENGKLEQQAEIEREEVIFRLEVTQKIEELQKKYYDSNSSQKEKDEYALEAGKLITEELLHNTKDNAGLL